MRSRASRLVLLLLLIGVGASAQGKREVPSVIVVPPAAKETEEKPSGVPMIGLEAYREVLASGNYIVGPGDEFVVYAANLEEPSFVKVMAEGGLLIPGVGSVRVAGLSLKVTREVVSEAYRQSFRQGQVTIELNRLRTFPVTVVGVVGEPGVTVASGVERISEVLRKAGGLGSKAARRNIRVARRGDLTAEAWTRLHQIAETGEYAELEKVTRRVDLELYGITGDSQYNPFAEDGDLIVVPPQAGEVGILGAVQREGFFEYVAGDRLSDLLTLGQGLAPGCESGNASLYRYVEGHQRKIVVPVDLAGVRAHNPESDLLLQSEDWLVVRQVPGYNQRSTVRVLGEVVYPGYYVIEKGRTTLRQLIDMAGGFTDDASLREARVIRQREEAEGTDKDPEFDRIATVPVADRSEDDDQYYIMKTREKPGHMVVDLVALFEQGDESQNIVMQPDDLVMVPATPRTVMVSGQAAYPGAVVFDSTYTVWDYIQRAGGLGWRASKDIRVIKARTGEMRRARDAGQMEPGDRIWIKERPQRDYWAIFTQTMGVIGQVSTLVLLYATLTN